MEIRGQIRIHRLSELNTLKLNLWFGMRHCRYDMETVTHDMVELLDEIDNSLFGEYGQHGEFLIPSVKWHRKLATAGIDYMDSDDMRYFQKRLENAMFIIPANIREYSNPCGSQLYYDFRIVSPAGDEYSYLVWNGREKVFFHKEAFEYLHSFLSRLKSGFVEGKMARLDYGEVETVTVDGGIIKIERKGQEEIQEGKDYIVYVPGQEPPKNVYVVCYRKDAVRNQEVFTGKEEEFEDESLIYDDDLWEEVDFPLYLGIVHAYDCYSARQEVAKKEDVPMDMLVAEEVCR